MKKQKFFGEGVFTPFYKRGEMTNYASKQSKKGCEIYHTRLKCNCIKDNHRNGTLVVYDDTIVCRLVVCPTCCHLEKIKFQHDKAVLGIAENYLAKNPIRLPLTEYFTRAFIYAYKLGEGVEFSILPLFLIKKGKRFEYHYQNSKPDRRKRSVGNERHIYGK